ncbi:MAG: bifunctional 4-hydroxy-3-methylbut-2-enyl diphosphate reductase/30S ribosomal protein S1, partial [Clostridia bacterium]|nr:bifunctional 4-hydroxy-3-methylbut-2-enyl diphosphate reductase/30S ribosomal protein S1 [Clostridia bacterium]
ENIDLVVSNTICKATGLRQKETDKISKKVDFMIIIGGKNSSNTKKLYEISLKNCINTILIETKKEINEKLKQKIIKFEKIGIMAGASTPESSIDDVIEYLKQNNKNEINV